MVTFADVLDSHRRIRDVIRITPLWPATVSTATGPIDVLFKLEQLQISGTFKARGSFAMVLKMREKGQLSPAGVAIASGGNAGIAAAHAARHVGVPVTVFVPTHSPQAKIEQLKALGATVIDGGTSHADTHIAVAKFIAESEATLLHPYDMPQAVAGAGTLALEVHGQYPEHGPMLVAVGGGGLLAGTALVGDKEGFTTVAVEPVGAPTLHQALQAGRPVPVDINTIAADSLGAKVIGDIAFEVCSVAPVESVLVTDQAISASREYLWDEYRLLVENSAGAVLAALHSGIWTPPDDRPPVIVLCGANISVNR